MPERPPVTGMVVMALFALWAGGLGAGFAVVVAVSYGELGALRVVLFVFLAVVLLAASARTVYELVHRVRTGR